MSDRLAAIIAYKRDEVAALKRQGRDWDAQARAQSPPRGFAAALKRKADSDGVALIAEIKKASPSRGLIRADFDPPALARAYEAGGAACLSVLTDRPSFQGADEVLIAARAACALPCLRKDFMIDPVQIAQSRALGADAVLIIMAAVDDACAVELANAARDYGMDVLIECHDRAELEGADPGEVHVGRLAGQRRLVDLGRPHLEREAEGRDEVSPARRAAAEDQIHLGAATGHGRTLVRRARRPIKIRRTERPSRRRARAARPTARAGRGPTPERSTAPARSGHAIRRFVRKRW